jgi:hypothetical protein
MIGRYNRQGEMEVGFGCRTGKLPKTRLEAASVGMSGVVSSELIANSCETACWLAMWVTEYFNDCPQPDDCGAFWSAQ